jgi:hypothetical protein
MGTMGRMFTMAWAGVLSASVAGCFTVPTLDTPPVLIRPDAAVCVSNPVWVPSLGLDGDAYARVFEKTLEIVGDYFEISYSNRYDGSIETFASIAPGFERFFKPGSPDCYQRLEATLQTIQHRAQVSIQPAEDGGFFIRVTVYKELFDTPYPVRVIAGAAAFRQTTDVERQFEVIDPTVFEPGSWIPHGRDTELEQLILQRLKSCM